MRARKLNCLSRAVGSVWPSGCCSVRIGGVVVRRTCWGLALGCWLLGVRRPSAAPRCGATLGWNRGKALGAQSSDLHGAARSVGFHQQSTIRQQPTAERLGPPPLPGRGIHLRFIRWLTHTGYLPSPLRAAWRGVDRCLLIAGGGLGRCVRSSRGQRATLAAPCAERRFPSTINYPPSTRRSRCELQVPPTRSELRRDKLRKNCLTRRHGGHGDGGRVASCELQVALCT